MKRGFTSISRCVRYYGSATTKASKSTTLMDPMKNVIGLTSNCVKTNESKQVNGTGSVYTPSEYFGYNRMSYHEAEVEMEKFRVPQPVAPRK